MRYLAVVLLLAATASYVLLHPPLDLAAGHGALAACPAVFGGWNGTDLSFADAVLEELKADDILVRRYVLGTQVTWLTIVYHQNRRYGSHDPRLCYESQGYMVTPLGRRRVADGSPAGLQVNVFRAVRPHERRLVYYWWTTSGLSTTDVAVMRQHMALAGALDNRSWGAFVRVETRLGDGGEPAAGSALDDFCARVARALPGVFAAAERRPAR
jgi:EpsI family protein